MKENRAYYFGLTSIGLLLIATVLGTIEFMSDTILRGFSSASLIMTVATLMRGRKELLVDPNNKKSKIGFIIGIVMISLQVLSGVVALLMVNRNLGIYFELMGWLGFIVTFIVLIIFIVQKKPLKRLFIILGCCIIFVIFIESLIDLSPGTFFGMTGFLGLITTIVVLIVFRIQKKRLIIPLIILGVCIVLFIFGICITEPTTMSSTAQTTTLVPTDELSADKNSTELAKSMQKYEVLSIEEFESLPRQERLIYAQYLINKTRESGDYDKIYTGENEKFAKKYVEPSIDDSGQEILDNNGLNLQYAAIQHIDKEMTADTLDAKKLLSIPFLYVGEDQFLSGTYLQEKAIIEKHSEVFVFHNNSTALDTSDTITYNYNADTVLPAKIVKFTDDSDGVTKYAEFALSQIINEDKSVQYSWSLIAIASTAEDLENIINSLAGIQ